MTLVTLPDRRGAEAPAAPAVADDRTSLDNAAFLAAVLRAAAHGKVKLLFPMLAHVSEITQTLAQVDLARYTLLPNTAGCTPWCSNAWPSAPSPARPSIANARPTAATRRCSRNGSARSCRSSVRKACGW